MQITFTNDLHPDLKTNLQVLVYLIKRQRYYTNIVEAANNNAGSYMKNNKLYFFEYFDQTTKRKYQMTAYMILYAMNRMYEYTLEQYNSSSLVKENWQVFGNKYEEFKNDTFLYKSFYLAYQEALFYGDVYTNIQNSFYYKNSALEGNFIFRVPRRLFPNINEDQIIKKYSNKDICRIYASLNPYYN